ADCWMVCEIIDPMSRLPSGVMGGGASTTGAAGAAGAAATAGCDAGALGANAPVGGPNALVGGPKALVGARIPGLDARSSLAFDETTSSTIIPGRWPDTWRWSCTRA